MTDPDQLPALPYMTLNGLSIEQWKARADALQAEFGRKFDFLAGAAREAQEIARERQERADALEAALRSSIPFVEHYALRNKKWEYEGVEQDPSGVHATLAAARALLEKKT